MLPPPMKDAIIPEPTEEEFLDMSKDEEQIDNELLATNAFPDEDEAGTIKVRLRRNNAVH